MKDTRSKLFRIIFETDTRSGKVFDIILLCAILLSLIVVILESLSSLREQYYLEFFYIEWFFTFIFTIEYFIRIWISPKPAKYIFSGFGIIDLLAILPTYLSFFFAGTHFLLAIRGIRLLRVFRILKLNRFMGQGELIVNALKRSSGKISVFLFAILNIVIIIGALMYVVEGEENGFSSIPKSIYWAIVTITTVGYGDISPQTALGQFISSIIMIVGYAIIAVPTGIISAEMVRQTEGVKKPACPACGEEYHAESDNYCANCGEKLMK